MNRRSFLKALVAVPFAGVAAKKLLEDKQASRCREPIRILQAGSSYTINLPPPKNGMAYTFISNMSGQSVTITSHNSSLHQQNILI